MNTPRVDSCKVFLRRIDGSGGTDEYQEPFDSLDTLFALVLDAKSQYQVDRMTLSGMDQDGERQVVTFIFQSVADTDS